MKRDMDIVRGLLLSVEKQSVNEANSAFSPDGFDQEALEIHLPLMLDKGLIEAKDWSSMSSRSWAMVRLTWEGHDFLDTVRDDEIWKATKSGLKKAGGFSFDLAKSLAKGLLKKKVEKHTGVELDL